MSDPNDDPFSTATSCSVCPADQNGTDTENAATTCCGAVLVTAGTCTACTSAIASGCTAVTCDVGYVNIDDDATNGCEVLCAPVTDGTCAACTSALAGACTAVKCVAGRSSMDNDANNGCEVDKLPNGDGSGSATGNLNSLRRAVSDWIAAGGASSSAVYIKYGPIEEWDVSDVSNLNYVFYNFGNFNSDLSKWETGKVTNMYGSKCTLLGVVFFFQTRKYM